MLPTAPPHTEIVVSVVKPDLRPVFRRAVSSVWAITTAGETGPVGLTALSVHSVSVDPPLVSFNISRTSHSLASIVRTGRVALHLLDENQGQLMTRFAGPREARFRDDGLWSWDRTGLPRLTDVAARLTATVRDAHEAGDSCLIVAEVDSAEHVADRGPLAHHNGAHHSVSPSVSRTTNGVR